MSSDVLAERDLQKFVHGAMESFVGAFSERFRSGKDAGELPAEFDADAAAHVITTYLEGLFHTALLGYDRPRLERQIGLFLTGLGL
jgi:hypothetical protein